MIWYHAPQDTVSFAQSPTARIPKSRLNNCFMVIFNIKLLYLSLVHHQLPILIRIIAQEPLGTHLMLPLFKSPADPLDRIFRYRPTLILCQERQNGKQNLTFLIQCIDVFLFKYNTNPQILEFSDIIQAIQRVSCKPGNRIGDFHINLIISQFPLPNRLSKV